MEIGLKKQRKSSMLTVALIFKEIAHRKINFVLGVLAVVMAVTLLVGFVITEKTSSRETARIMLKMGFNLRIIPKDTDMNKFLIDGFSDQTMPQEYLDILAGGQEVFSYNHLLATLHRKISWQGFDVILTGLATEVCPPGKERPPMSYEIELGTVYIGYELATRLKLKKGDTIEIGEQSFTIAGCLSESGSADDIRIQSHIRDAQEITGLKGRINEIQAVDCLCFAPTDDPLTILREEIVSRLPEAKVFQAKKIAEVRKQQRIFVQKYFDIIVPFVIIICAAWVGILAMMNVRERRQEIGVMRALGYGSGKISLLFLGKAVVIGLLGAALGFVLGTVLAMTFGPYIFKLTAGNIKPVYGLLGWFMVAAPLFSAVCSLVPTMTAVTQDPVVTLREE